MLPYPYLQGFSCAAYAALPAALRSLEDAALLRLGAARGWRRCPACRQMVERAGGCNHMRCRCGRMRVLVREGVGGRGRAW